MLGMILLLAQPEPPPTMTQAEIVTACAEDVRGRSRATRYLDLGHMDAKVRTGWRTVLSVHVNHLSTEPTIKTLSAVPGTGGAVLRLDLEAYGEPWLKAWEQLSDADPWYHVTVEVEAVEVKWEWRPGTETWRDPETGKTYRGRWIEHRVKVKKQQARALAPWVVDGEKSKAALAYLVEATGSQVPVVRADWFLWQTCQQQGRTPGYYDFVGVKKLADIDRLAGFDEKLLRSSKRTEWLEAVSVSGISPQSRRIRADPSIGEMKKWTTFDSEKTTEKKNALRVLDSDNFEFEFGETFYSLPNGLWGVSLQDAKGALQKQAPAFLTDTTSRAHNDRSLNIYRSCVGCHYGSDGLLAIDGWARNLYRPPIGLKAFDQKLISQYLRDLDSVIDRDRKTFAATMKREFGTTPKDYAKDFGDAFGGYDRPRDLEQISRDVGTGAAVIQQRVIARLKAGTYTDPLIAQWAHPKARQKAITVGDYHEVLPQIMELVKQ